MKFTATSQDLQAAAVHSAAGWSSTCSFVSQDPGEEFSNCFSPALQQTNSLFCRRMVIDWRCMVVGYPGEVMTDMDYSIYPAGFYTVRQLC